MKRSIWSLLKKNKIFFVIIITFIVTVSLTTISHSQTDRILSCAPQDKIYNYQNVPYCVRLIVNHYMFRDEHYLFITAGKDNTYGALLRYPDTFISEPSNIETEWSKEGLLITSHLKYEIFVAKDYFVSGR